MTGSLHEMFNRLQLHFLAQYRLLFLLDNRILNPILRIGLAIFLDAVSLPELCIARIDVLVIDACVRTICLGSDSFACFGEFQTVLVGDAG